jgi:tetratricopeptide (TPR) repeat protein
MAVSGGLKNPRYAGVLESDLKDFAEMAVAVEQDSNAPKADPVIEFAARNFAADAKQSYSAYKAGDMAWSRFAFQRAGDQCTACHTRADRGARDFPLAWQSDLSALKLPARIHFWLANRQYSKAMAGAEQLASDQKLVAEDSLKWLESLQKVMTMVVRVKADDWYAGKLTQIALNNPAVPFFIRNDLKQWSRDIQTWRSHKSKLPAKQRLQLAQRLMKDGPASFVNNLRASAILHELLENSESAGYLVALQVSGKVSEYLGEFALAQFYYESCIRALPHSLPAEQCYGHLITSVRKNNPMFDESAQNEAAWNLEILRRMAAPPREPRSHFEESP